jgi:uncharacterized membrane protein HdeD (DUF308 family)
MNVLRWTRLVDRLPGWARVLLGLCCAGAGVLLALRPFTSLTVLVVLLVAGLVISGIGDIATGPRVLGVGELVAAVAIAVWPGYALRALPVVVGAGLVLFGLVTAARGLRRVSDEPRLAAVLGGAAAIGFGVLALIWPDAAMVATGLLLAACLVVVGARLLVGAVRNRSRVTLLRPSRRKGTLLQSRIGHGVRVLGAAAAMVVAVALLAAGAGTAAAPRPDAFYDPPSDPPASPGRLLRVEAFDGAVPAGARAWRILYTTTDAAGAPAAASGLVLAANVLPAGPRPVIAWAHGTTGVAAGCAPSELPTPFAVGAIPALRQIVDSGVVLVAPDYPGLGAAGPSPFLIGPGEGHAVLDAVRATRAIAALQISGDVVVWGHTQGGHAALWAGTLAAAYAPDLRIGGVAAIAPATDLVRLVKNFDVVPGGAVFSSYMIKAYADAYPDVLVDSSVRPMARVLVSTASRRCLFEPAANVSLVAMGLLDSSIWRTPPDQGPLGERLRQNTPTGPFPTPVMIAQGSADQLVLPAMQDAYMQQRCAAGARIDYRTYPGRDHGTILAPESALVPDLVAWTIARFTGQPDRSTCGPR